MIAETVYACTKQGIQADQIGYVGINIEKNTLLVISEKGQQFAVVDAFSAAKAEPEARLQESGVLMASVAEQHEQSQQLQLAQQSERSFHGMSR